ncbi:MAG TPA: YciI family protein [Gaiellaceae bacterium]|nr:YciI family protein [Gaiellaceae bacterium]
MIYSDPSIVDGLTPEEIQARREEVIPEWMAWFEYLEAKAKSVDGRELDESMTAKTLRYENGEPVVTDGPYAETKEQIGGYMLVECDNLDEAIDMAARSPITARGSVEVRPVVE